MGFFLLSCSQQDSSTQETAIEEKATAFEQTSAAVEEAAAPILKPAVPVIENPDHDAMLASDDPQLAANKRYFVQNRALAWGNQSHESRGKDRGIKDDKEYRASTEY